MTRPLPTRIGSWPALPNTQATAVHQVPPCAQQIGINVVSRRYRPDAGARFSRLRDDPQLVFQAPPSPSFPAVDDLDLIVRHLCKVDLKELFKVLTLAIPQPRTRRPSPEAYGSAGLSHNCGDLDRGRSWLCVTRFSHAHLEPRLASGHSSQTQRGTTGRLPNLDLCQPQPG